MPKCLKTKGLRHFSVPDFRFFSLGQTSKAKIGAKKTIKADYSQEAARLSGRN